MRRLEVIGQKFARLTILSDASKAPRKVLCRCDCGSESVFQLSNVIYGLSKSCGCLARELSKVRKEKLVEGTPSNRHPLYQTWKSMKNRCCNPKDKAYKYYGGKGVSVCPRWLNSFAAFVSDMGPKPTKKHSLDRLTPSHNYGPETCRWATDVEQRRNRTSCIYIAIGGVTKTMTEWGRYYGLPEKLAQTRIARGWDPVKAVSAPVFRRESARQRRQSVELE